MMVVNVSKQTCHLNKFVVFVYSLRDTIPKFHRRTVICSPEKVEAILEYPGDNIYVKYQLILL